MFMILFLKELKSNIRLKKDGLKYESVLLSVLCLV